MIKSMTGYGRTVTNILGKKITIEVKTLNSKQLDLSVRFPAYYKEKELDVRKLLLRTLKRGKVEFSMYVEVLTEETNISINEKVYKAYYKQMANIYSKLNVEMPSEVHSGILRLPDVLSSAHEELDESEWNQIQPIIEQAIEACNHYRTEEGKSLYTDFTARIIDIQKLLEQITPLEKLRIDSIRQRIRAKLEEFIDKDRIDENRLEQELIYFLDKLDINEEMVRLSNHCKYFLATMEDSDGNGKKLGFICQEIGREINTLGAKANDAVMQKIVVQMKDQLEKIKEQSLNVL